MNVLNAVLFKVNWFACVVGGALWGLAGIGALLVFSHFANSLRRDLVLVGIFMLLGAILDTIWIASGILDYGTRIAPLWIVMLWMGLAFTLNHAMAYFKQQPLIGALLAAGAAPVTYLTGQSLGAVVVPDTAMLGCVAAAWFAMFYLTFSQLPKFDAAINDDVQVMNDSKIATKSMTQT